MGVGLSDGTSYADSAEHIAETTARPLTKVYITGKPDEGNTPDPSIPKTGEIKPPTQTNDQNVVTPQQLFQGRDMQRFDTSIDNPEGGLDVSFKGLPEAPAEPAGALKSSGGTQTPGKALEAESDPTIATIPIFKQLGLEGGDIKQSDIDQAINIGMAAGPGTMAGVKGISNLQGLAKNEALSNLGHAQILEGIGEHPDDVLYKTGFFRGADGRWRTEIDDSKAVLDENWYKKEPEQHHQPKDPLEQTPFQPNVGTVNAKLPDVLKHDELYQHYPFLKDIDVIHDPSLVDYGGYAAPGKIVLGDQLVAHKDTFLHEIQHLIQNHEGFAAGGSYGLAGKSYNLKLAYLAQKKIEEPLQALYDKAVTPEGLTSAESAEYVRLRDLAEKFQQYAAAGDAKAREFYDRLAGEVESRNVEVRSDLTAQQRRIYPPSGTEDVPRSQQIIKSYPTRATPYGMVNAHGQVEPQRSPIRSAALRVGNKTYEGVNHYDAIEKLKSDIGELPDNVEDGFVTNEGKFIDRHQAAKLVGIVKEQSSFAKMMGIDNRGLGSEEIPELNEKSKQFWKDRSKKK